MLDHKRAEDKAPLLIEWHEEKDESQNHTAAQEDPVEQESLPVTIEITPAEPEPPDTSKVAEASALEKDWSVNTHSASSTGDRWAQDGAGSGSLGTVTPSL